MIFTECHFVHTRKILRLRVESLLTLLTVFHNQQKFKQNQHKENVNDQYKAEISDTDIAWLPRLSFREVIVWI